MVRQLIAFFLTGLLAGCASFQVGGDFQSGRQALLRIQSEQALPYFLEAGKKEPDYVYESMYFREGIWTYVGRTEYAVGKLKEAQQSLERALAKDKDDNMARLYLGLTLMGSGEHERGLPELKPPWPASTTGSNTSSAPGPSKPIGALPAKFAALSKRISKSSKLKISIAKN